MIVQYGDRFREWSGLSTETKPTTGVRPGDEFVEIDTGRRFKYDRDGEVWVESFAKTKEVIFHSASTTSNPGIEFEVGEYQRLRVKIFGTSTTRTVMFRGIVGDDVPEALLGFRSNDFVMGNSTTDNNEIWEFDIAGYDKVFFGLAEVAGGNVSVIGKAVR